MLIYLAIALQAAVILLVLYNSVVSLFGWRNPQPIPVGQRARPIRVVIAAHNEATVIAGILSDLEEQDYGNYSVTTIADRCSDSTAAIAAEKGQVAERHDGPDGKGAALAWYLELQPLGSSETLVVLDADNRIGPGFLAEIADAIDAGHEAIQCYLDVLRPGSSLLTTASALTYWAGNRMVQLARSNLGWSADLGGTGMAFSAEALEAAGGFSSSLTEDQDLGIRLMLNGTNVTWLHTVRIRDEKPSNLKVATRQRARWAAGRRVVLRHYGNAILKEFVKTGRLRLLDQLIRLVQPGRSFIALVSFLLTLAATAGVPGMLNWRVWILITAGQFLLPIGFLKRDAIENRYIIRYPFVVLIAAMWIPVQVLSRMGSSGWFHTPHSGE